MVSNSELDADSTLEGTFTKMSLTWKVTWEKPRKESGKINEIKKCLPDSQNLIDRYRIRSFYPDEPRL